MSTHGFLLNHSGQHIKRISHFQYLCAKRPRIWESEQTRQNIPTRVFTTRARDLLVSSLSRPVEQEKRTAASTCVRSRWGSREKYGFESRSMAHYEGKPLLIWRDPDGCQVFRQMSVSAKVSFTPGCERNWDSLRRENNKSRCWIKRQHWVLSFYWLCLVYCLFRRLFPLLAERQN